MGAEGLTGLHMSNKFLLNERGNLILKETTKETLLFISPVHFLFFRSSFYFTFVFLYVLFCCCFASDTHAMYDVMSIVTSAMKLLFGICAVV